MKASKLYQNLCLNGDGYCEEYDSINDYFDMLTEACKIDRDIKNMMIEAGLHSLKKYLKKAYKK